MMLVKYNNP